MLKKPTPERRKNRLISPWVILFLYIIVYVVWMFVSYKKEVGIVETLYTVNACLLIVIAIFVYNYRKLKIEEEKKELTTWCLYGNLQSGHFHCETDFEYLQMYLKKEISSSKHQITKEDKEYITNILNEFRKELNIKYFSNRIGIPKSNRVISKEEFFIYQLLLFLDKHNHTTEPICNYKLWDKIIEEKLHETQTVIYKYSLSDFGNVYYKLYYLCYVYCKNKESINPNNKYLHEYQKEDIEKVISEKKF